MVIPGSKGQSVGLINTAADFSSFFKPQETQPLTNQTQQQNYQQTLIPQKQQTVESQQKSSFFTPTPVVMSKSINSGNDNLAKESTVSYINQSEFKTNSISENRNSLTPELIKTDSIKRAENNTTDIFQKNKELMSLEQKAKQNEVKKAPTTAGPTIINHYNTSDNSAPMNTNYKDPLENLKMQYRSYPAWRTQVG